MGPLEILAFILAVIVLVKALFFAINPKFIVRLTAHLLEKKFLYVAIHVILAIMVGYFVFSALSIVEVAAVMLFTSLILGTGFMFYTKSLHVLTKEILKNRKAILVTFIFWIIFSLVILASLFL